MQTSIIVRLFICDWVVIDNELHCPFFCEVDDLLAMEQEIDLEVKSLETCAYSATTFGEILAKIQKAVDNLSLHSYSNLPQWVAKLDEEVCTYLFHS